MSLSERERAILRQIEANLNLRPPGRLRRMHASLWRHRRLASLVGAAVAVVGLLAAVAAFA